MTLNTARVWLSGSIPAEIDGEAKQRIEEFVELLCTVVFREGGTILHGSDPSLSPIIHAAAQRVFDSTEGQRKCQLINVVSRHWSKDWEDAYKDSINKFCVEPFVETMESL